MTNKKDSFSIPYDLTEIHTKRVKESPSKSYKMLDEYHSMNYIDSLFSTIFIESYFNNPKE